MKRKFIPTAYSSFALERGDWDATWYCTGCYMEYYNMTHAEVRGMLGFQDRSTKKARYL